MRRREQRALRGKMPNIGIQMKRIELTKGFIIISTLKKPLRSLWFIHTYVRVVKVKIRKRWPSLQVKEWKQRCQTLSINYPRLRNTRLREICLAQSLDVLNKRLKTHLFQIVL